MSNPPDDQRVARQHLIDPEVCIRCNTCEATCPVGAVTHDDRNYVVRFGDCNACGACIPLCPTGAIDNWRQVITSQAYTIEEQLTWDSLPTQRELRVVNTHELPDGNTDELPEEVVRVTALAVAGQGGISQAPFSAERPHVNLFGMRNPATATVTGNFRLTDPTAGSDIRHLVLHFGTTEFPVLEGQSIGIVPPGIDANGRPHHVRLYSVASPRNGERPNHNNLSLTVKRVSHDHEGEPIAGVGSNYLCDLKAGDRVKVVGPYGDTFLMPNHPGSSLLMICTGTGAAPMRAMTEWRRRRMELKDPGKLMLFFGARAPGELPYFGPLMSLPNDFIDVNLAFSRVPGQRKQYVQDLIRERAQAVIQLLCDENAYVFVCGLKSMEPGVDEAFGDVCREHGFDWSVLRPTLLAQGRLHVETY
jgi:benzoyl-CoA 2,3-epoxidase subunit A